MKVISAVVANIFTSLFISFIIFIATYSFISGQFPPDFRKMAESAKALRNYAETIKNLAQKNGAVKPSDEESVASLQALQRQQQELLAKLSGQQPGAPAPAAANPIEERLAESERRISSLQSKVEALIIEMQILRNGKAPAPAPAPGATQNLPASATTSR
jgi:hypothetical protein